MKKTETGYGILNGLLILFIAIDTFFIFPIYEGIGSSIVVSIVLSILITGILDSASYVASSWGLARLFVIPRINQFQIKKDRLIAIIIFVAVLGLTIGIQTFLVFQRIGQISEKNEALKIEQVEYDKRIQTIMSADYPSEMERETAIRKVRKAVYDGNRTFDFFTMIIPIVTTLLSFVLGLIPVLTGKIKYDKFDKIRDKLVIDREAIEKKLSDLSSKYEDKMSKISRFAGGRNLSNITHQQLNSIKQEIKDSIEKNFRAAVPAAYDNDINELYNRFLADVSQIQQDMSDKASNKEVIMTDKYLNVEEIKEQIIEMKAPRNEIEEIKKEMST